MRSTTVKHALASRYLHYDYYFLFTGRRQVLNDRSAATVAGWTTPAVTVAAAPMTNKETTNVGRLPGFIESCVSTIELGNLRIC